MSLISTVPATAATGETAAIYRETEQAMGRVPNALAVLSASPERLRE